MYINFGAYCLLGIEKNKATLEVFVFIV